MYTPQEVSEKTFPKSSGLSSGYSMTAVDEFLDGLTEDYTALYKDNTTLKAKLKVVLVKPSKYDEDATAIADHLLEKRTVVVNMENTDPDTARRLLDFVSGVAYATGGKVKRVAAKTYIATPYSVDLMGDLIDELENSGLYM